MITSSSWRHLSTTPHITFKFYEQLVKCYYNLEDYDNLENLVDSLQPDDKLLVAIGNMFATVGMGQQAVEAYTKVQIHIVHDEISLKDFVVQTKPERFRVWS